MKREFDINVYFYYIYQMSSKTEVYNVDNYTDKELYDILDLTDPSDRVLEAKINSNKKMV